MQEQHIIVIVYLTEYLNTSNFNFKHIFQFFYYSDDFNKITFSILFRPNRVMANKNYHRSN